MPTATEYMIPTDSYVDGKADICVFITSVVFFVSIMAPHLKIDTV